MSVARVRAFGIAAALVPLSAAVAISVAWGQLLRGYTDEDLGQRKLLLGGPIAILLLLYVTFRVGRAAFAVTSNAASSTSGPSDMRPDCDEPGAR